LPSRSAAGEGDVGDSAAADGLDDAARSDFAGRGVVTVVPVTGNTDPVYPFQVFLAATTIGLPVDSKAQAE